MLSDMRESGSIEQDADIVILLHREDAYDHEARPGEADFIIAKHRGGPTDTIAVAFRKDVRALRRHGRGHVGGTRLGRSSPGPSLGVG